MYQRRYAINYVKDINTFIMSLVKLEICSSISCKNRKSTNVVNRILSKWLGGCGHF